MKNKPYIFKFTTEAMPHGANTDFVEITGSTLKGAMRSWTEFNLDIDTANEYFGFSNEDSSQKAKVDIICNKKIRQGKKKFESGDMFEVILRSSNKNKDYIDKYKEILCRVGSEQGIGKKLKSGKGKFVLVPNEELENSKSDERS